MLVHHHLNFTISFNQGREKRNDGIKSSKGIIKRSLSLWTLTTLYSAKDEEEKKAFAERVERNKLEGDIFIHNLFTFIIIIIINLAEERTKKNAAKRNKKKEKKRAKKREKDNINSDNNDLDNDRDDDDSDNDNNDNNDNDNNANKKQRICEES